MNKLGGGMLECLRLATTTLGLLQPQNKNVVMKN